MILQVPISCGFKYLLSSLENTMKVNIEGEGKIEVPEGSQVSTVIEKLDHHIDSVIVLCDGEPITLDDELEENMTLKILPVVSGG